MAKSNGHYSGWIKKDEVKRGFTGPIGVKTTSEGFHVVKFAKPARIDGNRLRAAIQETAKAKSAG